MLAAIQIFNTQAARVPFKALIVKFEHPSRKSAIGIQMSYAIIRTLREKPPAEATRLINVAMLHIHDKNFVNLLHQFDVNDARNDAYLVYRLKAFAAVTHIREEVVVWLAS